MLSTAGHWDQSSRAIVQFLPSFSVRDLASIVTSPWHHSLPRILALSRPDHSSLRDQSGVIIRASGQVFGAGEYTHEVTRAHLPAWFHDML
jgi:hypothetical protein